MVALVSSILAGTTDPEAQPNPNAARILANNSALRSVINASRTEIVRKGEKRVIWNADLGRVGAVVVKNARGHALYEFGEPMFDDPEETRREAAAFDGGF